MRISKKLIIASLCFASLGIAQDSSKTYIATEIQNLRLKIKQEEAIIARKDLDDAQRNFNIAMNDLQEEAKTVKKDNKWPDNLVFDIQTLLFSEPKPATKIEPKK